MGKPDLIFSSGLQVVTEFTQFSGPMQSAALMIRSTYWNPVEHVG